MITCVAIFAASVYLANPNSHGMPTEYLDGLNAKLISEGYRELRIIDTDQSILSAVDQSGKTVMLIGHSTSNQILEAH